MNMFFFFSKRTSFIDSCNINETLQPIWSLHQCYFPILRHHHAPCCYFSGFKRAFCFFGRQAVGDQEFKIVCFTCDLQAQWIMHFISAQTVKVPFVSFLSVYLGSGESWSGKSCSLQGGFVSFFYLKLCSKDSIDFTHFCEQPDTFPWGFGASQDWSLYTSHTSYPANTPEASPPSPCFFTWLLDENIHQWLCRENRWPCGEIEDDGKWITLFSTWHPRHPSGTTHSPIFPLPTQPHLPGPTPPVEQTWSIPDLE